MASAASKRPRPIRLVRSESSEGRRSLPSVLVSIFGPNLGMPSPLRSGRKDGLTARRIGRLRHRRWRRPLRKGVGVGGAIYSAFVSEVDGDDREESHPVSAAPSPIFSTLLYRYGDWLRVAEAAANSPHLSAASSAVELARNWTPSPQLTTAIEAFRAADFSTQIIRLQRMIVPAVPKLDAAWLFRTLDLGEPRRYFPDNWDPILSDLDIDVIDSIAAEDGIPVAWTPGSPVLTAMMQAADRQERMGILVENLTAVLDGCENVLGGISHADLEEHRGLARESIAAYRLGLHAAAGALAIAVATAIAEARGWHGDSKQLIKKIRITDDTPVALTIEYVTRAPLAAFLATWRPGTPHPAAPSRHAVSHEVSRDDLTDAASLVAIMLATSLIQTTEFQLDLARRNR